MAKLKTPKAWTKHARGQECTMRMSRICNFNPETTVFAHRHSWGLGLKGVWGAFACSDCHDVYDGRVVNPFGGDPDEAHCRGCFETLDILIRDGLLVL